MKRTIDNILEDLSLLPGLIHSHPLDVAYTLGTITAKLEMISKTLDNMENQRHGC